MTTNNIKQEETVKKAEEVVEEVDLAFSVVKLKSGHVLVQKVDGYEPGSHDDIYNACNQVQRSLDVQNVAGAIQMAMIEAANHAKSTEGLVVPDVRIK